MVDAVAWPWDIGCSHRADLLYRALFGSLGLGGVPLVHSYTVWW